MSGGLLDPIYFGSWPCESASFQRGQSTASPWRGRGQFAIQFQYNQVKYTRQISFGRFQHLNFLQEIFRRHLIRFWGVGSLSSSRTSSQHCTSAKRRENLRTRQNKIPTIKLKLSKNNFDGLFISRHRHRYILQWMAETMVEHLVLGILATRLLLSLHFTSLHFMRAISKQGKV